MKMNEDEKRVRRLLRRINKTLPPPLPVILRFVKEEEIEGCLGLCIPYYDKFVIKIIKGDLYSSIYTLVHELAHVHHFDENNFHSEEWAKQYSKIWKITVQEE